jgi:UDP-N-acetylmuramyl pentapeptide phosphotransferase/UDP-N-acetylglucosamine-1-phosphate transferase
MSNYWLACIVAAFVVCVGITGFLIPKILLISFRRRLFDVPDERKIHKGVVPRLGGIAFMPSILLVISLFFGLMELLRHHGLPYVLPASGSCAQPLIFSVCAVLILYLIGIADDLIGVRYRAKFAAQTCCAVFLVMGGLWVNNLHGLLGIHSLPYVLGIPLTLLMVVFITNAINLIDGIDGLASGLCSSAMLIWGYVFFCMQDYVFSMLAFCTLGVLVPFFYYNVFGNVDKHKKIFMGDTGTLTIGIVISILVLRLIDTVHGNAVVGGMEYQWNLVVVVAAPLLIPCFDVVRVYMGRVHRHQNPFLPDKTHIHHKLLKAGMSQRTAMVSLVVTSVVSSLFFITLSVWIDVNVIVVAGVVLFTWGNRRLNTIINAKFEHEL